MNVCDDGGPIVIFRDDWSLRNTSENDKPKLAEDVEWIDHCRARELAERAAAKHASSARARRVHQELAQAYARMIRRAEVE
jgi:hypothetical protein